MGLLFLALSLGCSMVACRSPWGLSHLTINPLPYHAVLLLGVPLVVIGCWRRKFDENRAEARCLASRRNVLIFGAVAFSLLVVSRSEVHLLGDGYLFLGDLDRIRGERLWSGSFEPLWLLLVERLHCWLGSTSEWAELALRIPSVLSGGIYLLSLHLFIRKVVPVRAERPFAYLAMTAIGTMQLFCGYVEVYGAVAAGVMLWLSLGVRADHADGEVLALGAFAGLASLVHVSLVCLIPSLIFLAAAGGERRPWPRRLRRVFLAVIPLAAVMMLGAWLFDLAWLQRADPPHLRHILPLRGDLDDFQAYHLFSARHFVDIANIVLLTCPLAMILSPYLVFRPSAADHKATFVLIVAASFAGFAFLINPEIGFFRDWDLLSLPAVPFTAWVVMNLARQQRKPAALVCTMWFALVAAGASTASWVMLNASADKALARYTGLLESTHLSVHARAYGWETLGTYQRVHRDDLQSAAASYRAAILAAPDNPRLYSLAGVAEYEAGRTTSALHLLDLAVHLSDGDVPEYLDNLAAVRSAHGEHEIAVRLFRRSLYLEPEEPGRYRSLGLALANAGDYRAAADTLSIACRLSPGDSLAARALVEVDRLKGSGLGD